MDAPPEQNETDFTLHPQLILDKDGERLLAVVKATFEQSPETLAFELAAEERMRPVRFADIPWGEPEKSSIAYPADICPRKPATDVVVVAIAYAPGGKPVPSFDVYARVGPLKKALRVFGLRVWEAGGAGLSAPRPVAEVEMRYDNAWGGADDENPAKFVEEPRNPVGLGVAGDPDKLTHQLGPCIEDPEHPIKSHRTRPPPAGVGAIGRHWEPRRRYVGTYDDAWTEFRCPLPPLDQDDRVHQCASPGLVAEPPLKGGEACAFLNLVPGGGALEFALPRIAVEVEFHVKGREPEVVRPHLDTVLVDLLAIGPDKPPALELVWRASVKAPRKLKDSLTIVREVAWR
jgi:hypothetical protein